MERLKSAILKKAWEVDRITDDQKSMEIQLTSTCKEILTPTKTIEINGLERASTAMCLQNDAILQSLFNHLSTLLSRAKDVIAKACAMFPKLCLPVHLKTLKSSLIIAMVSSVTEEVIERNLLHYIVSLDSDATALEMGGKFNWSVRCRSGNFTGLYPIYGRLIVESILHMKEPNGNHTSKVEGRRSQQVVIQLSHCFISS